MHRRTFVEHRRTPQQSTRGAPRIALQLLRRGGAGANAVVRRGSPKAFSLRLLLCFPRMKVCYKPGFSIKDMMLFNNAQHRNLAIGNIFHVYSGARVGESVESALSALAAIFSALSAYFNNFRQKIPYFDASQQKRVLFNCFATKKCSGMLKI